MEFTLLIISWRSDFKGIAFLLWQAEGTDGIPHRYKRKNALFGIALKFNDTIQLDICGRSFNLPLWRDECPD